MHEISDDRVEIDEHSLKMMQGSFQGLVGEAEAEKAPRAASFGVWRAAKGGGEKSYVKKSGMELRGAEAMLEAKKELEVMAGNPAQLPRKVLEQSMCAAMLRDATAQATVVEPYAMASWGLPDAVLAAYKARGVSRLFEWQATCLQARGVLNGGKNLVYNAPTSGGKTLVAEMLMLRTLVRQPGKTVLFVVPMRAIAAEKVAYFRAIWGDSAHVSVQALTGDDQGTLTPDLDVAVVTMEKANMTLNRLLDKREENEGVDVSLVVVDELHLLGDPGRGFVLEVLIAKLKHYFPETQVCGMSATLPNLNEVASWMRAEMFSTQVEARALNFLICRNGVLIGEYTSYKLLSDKQLQSTATDADRRATESTVELCVNTVSNKGCVLLFCPTKKWVENTAEKVAEGLAKRIVLDGAQEDGVRALKKKLSWLRCGICPVLATTLTHGVAYHHSGLIPEERSLLEDAFKNGVVTVLVATTTLATGVNLPATRVIIRSTWHVTSCMFHQMCGRAGRVGLCSEKATHAIDAIVIVQSDKEQREAKYLYTSAIPDVKSALVEARGGGMGRLVLDGVVFGNWRYLVRCSFVWHMSSLKKEKQELLKQHEEEAVQNLRTRGFIEDCGSGEYRITALGKACCFSGLDPLKSSTALNSLVKARKTLLLVSEFHLVYLCTPPTHSCKVDWNEYKKFSQTLFTDYPDVRRVAVHLGFNEVDLNNLCNTNHDARAKSDKYTFYKTFYGAIVLYGLVMERPLMLVAEDMSLSRGELSALERDASTHAAMLISFCHRLNWTALADVLVPFSKRLVKGKHTSAIYTDLLRLGTDMPVHRAKVIYHNHLYTLRDVVTSGEERVAEILKECMPFDGSDPLVRPPLLASNHFYNHCQHSHALPLSSDTLIHIYRTPGSATKTATKTRVTGQRGGGRGLQTRRRIACDTSR